MNILFLGTQEIQKTHIHVSAGLADAQEDQVFFDFLYGGHSLDHVSEHCKGFDGVLCVVVVPRHTIVSQKGEKLFAITLETPLAFLGCLTGRKHAGEFAIKRANGRDMLLQKVGFQTESVNRFNYWFY